MADDDLIDDQYQTVMCIASGSSSQVWEVAEKASGRHLAMKLLKKDVPEFKQNKAQLKRESEVLKSLDHPLIVKFERYSSNRDHTYILMEYFRASNLKLQIKADTNQVHLKIRQLFEGICSALSHVHSKGYVHRDIKPDNILLNKAGEIRLCDFSLSSKQATGLGKMFAGKLKTIQGTRTYIAPETIRKRQPTFQTDLYSLGVLFFEVLACKTPFQAPTPEELLQKHLRAEAPNPSEFNPNVSPEMDRIIAKLLKKKPADRPASVDEVLAELKRIRIFKEDIIDEIAAKKANADNDAIAMLSEVRLDSRADAKLKEMLETNPEFAKKFLAEKQQTANKKKASLDLQGERIRNAEVVEAARQQTKAGHKKTGSAKAAAPTPQPQPQPQQPQMMPMPMQGYPSYPQGYAPYPQQQMPMPPGMGQPMPGVPQYPQQYPQPPQMAYPQPMQQHPQVSPQQQPQQPLPPAQPPRQQAQSTQAQPKQQTPAQVVQRPAVAAPTATGISRPSSQPPVASPKPATPPKPSTSVPSRAAPKPADPPPQAAADIEFMTELPDVL